MSDEARVMGNPRSKPPTEWENGLDGIAHVPGSEDIYVLVGKDVEVGGTAENVLIWHWHRPTNGDAHRWSAARCSLHQVLSVDPLHLEPSLACENGCSSHGWIRDGHWTDA
jgi:hypothetical protein